MNDVNDGQIGGDHYKTDYHHWDIVAKNRIGYVEAVAAKYVTRWRKKDGIRDLEKALHYIDKVLDLVKTINYRPSGIVGSADFQIYASANKLTQNEELACHYLFTWRGAVDLECAAACVRELIEQYEDDPRYMDLSKGETS